METPRGLTRRLEALERAVGAVSEPPCVGCGRLHVLEALSLEWISAVHMGADVAIPEI